MHALLIILINCTKTHLTLKFRANRLRRSEFPLLNVGDWENIHYGSGTSRPPAFSWTACMRFRLSLFSELRGTFSSIFGVIGGGVLSCRCTDFVVQAAGFYHIFFKDILFLLIKLITLSTLNIYLYFILQNWLILILFMKFKLIKAQKLKYDFLKLKIKKKC